MSAPIDAARSIRMAYEFQQEKLLEQQKLLEHEAWITSLSGKDLPKADRRRGEDLDSLTIGEEARLQRSKAAGQAGGMKSSRIRARKADETGEATPERSEATPTRAPEMPGSRKPRKIGPASRRAMP